MKRRLLIPYKRLWWAQRGWWVLGDSSLYLDSTFFSHYPYSRRHRCSCSVSLKGFAEAVKFAFQNVNLVVYWLLVCVRVRDRHRKRHRNTEVEREREDRQIDEHIPWQSLFWQMIPRDWQGVHGNELVHPKGEKKCMSGTCHILGYISLN